MTAVQEIPAGSPSRIPGDNNAIKLAWDHAKTRILSLLRDLTGSPCVIIRGPGGKSEDLMLEGFVFDTDCEANARYQVPLTKTTRYWGANTFETCMAQHYPDGSLVALPNHQELFKSLNESERAFLNAVHWRLSFPISVGDGVPRIAILLAYDEEKPHWINRPLVLNAWTGAQLVVSHQCGLHTGGVHETIASAIQSLSALASSIFNNESVAVGALLRLACSGHSIGWNRAWCLLRTADGYVADVCAGGATREQWTSGVAFAQETCRNLLDELIFEALSGARCQDPMTRLFDGVTLPTDIFADSGPRREGAESFASVPRELIGETVNKIIVRHAESKKLEFEPSLRYFGMTVSIGSKEYMIVTSNWSHCAETQLPLIETGAVLSAASSLLSCSSNDTYEATECLMAVLALAGIAPIQSHEIDLSLVRSNRILFQTSETYRRQVESAVTMKRSIKRL